MRQLMSLLSVIVSIYSLIIVIRIILTWFRCNVRIPDIITQITDPYLNWFRALTFLRMGSLDLSPVAALMVLSILNQVLVTLAVNGAITIGIILALLVRIIWSAVSFFLIFLIIVLALRLFAYLTSQNTYSAFWRVIDTISQPVLYRFNRLLFGGKIADYRTGMILSISIMVLAYFLLRIAVSIITGILQKMPV